jgi:hypothetical protein
MTVWLVNLEPFVRLSNRLELRLEKPSPFLGMVILLNRDWQKLVA